MTESPDATTGSAVATGPSAPRESDPRDRRLYRALAWVGIVAGVVFTVAVVFFSGLAVGRSSAGHHGWHRGYQSGQMGPGCPMMRGGMMGPGGGMGGMMDPDDRGPGMMRPDRSSAAPPPAAPPQR